MIDPNENEANIIIEAFPVVSTTPYEIYVKKVQLSSAENNSQHEHFTSLPIWMMPKEEIKNKADEYVKYFGVSTQYEDITTSIQNQK